MDALRVTNVSKRFGPVQALQNVSFDLQKGEIHALAGQNGAGKSTLIQIITGVYSRDSGEITVNGKAASIGRPRDAQDLGIACIYQEPILVPTLNAAGNIFLGREPIKHGLVDYGSMQKQTREVLRQLNYELDTEIPVSELHAVDLAVVNICRALIQGGSILILDEPTAALARSEIRTLFSFLKTLKSQGVSMIYISHHLEEVFEIADRVTVMRDGCIVNTFNTDVADVPTLIESMLGQKASAQYPPRRRIDPDSPVVFEAKGLHWKDRVNGIDLQLRRGEILGVMGAIGAGKTEMAHLIFGLARPDQGSLLVDGNPVDVDSPGRAVRLGITLVPEDRKREGLIQAISISDNISLPVLRRHVRAAGLLNKKSLVALAKEYVNRLTVKLDSVEQPASSLSGGNQQKVVLAKWLATESRILILDEPTQGIDVGAKRMIYSLLRELSGQGLSIVFISSDADEVLGVSDRVVVIRRGKSVAELDPSSTSSHDALDIAYAKE